MGKLIDLTGKRYNRLTVIAVNGKDKNGHPLWECCCDCGNTCFVTGSRLRSGNTGSCGCLHSEQLTERNTKHGKSGSHIYKIYKDMKSRCQNTKNKEYKNYGDRGIKVCNEWLVESGFENFYKWAMENGYKEDLTIDRIDVNGNYEPGNCRWATQKEQQNNKRNNHKIELNGEIHTIAEWSEITGIKQSMIEARLRVLKWPAKKALTLMG